MYISVIPFHASLGTEVLTYFVEDIFMREIAVGQLVEIPFGKKIISGIVAEIFEAEIFEKNFSQNSSAIFAKKMISIDEIRPIISIISTAQILDPYQITAIIRLAKKYLIPIHRILAIFLTEPISKRLIKQQFPLENIKTREKTRDDRIFLIQDDIVRVENILPHISQNSAIILADDFALWNFCKNLSEKDKNQTFCLSGDATDTKKAQAWIDIRNGKYQRIVGTRNLLRYNLRAYEDVVYVEDAFATGYRYFPIEISYTDMLAFLSEDAPFNIKIFTSIPKLTTLTTFRHFSLTHLSCLNHSTSSSPDSSDIFASSTESPGSGTACSS